ncbi:TadE/TadG family type IV pilus assembly protein [Comamonas sp. NoAH]|uniref:TadE/TadG family type IV pilus assembly protein n=1 Tax=Comamonas halotolerans TaxID=3041496 RepID=UPI0024E09E4B|nr:TadE/TadG family type IV pilus assembly protein [Comamonas sp. NoAH]
MKRNPAPWSKLRQHGVYAVEWAIVFPVFFMLIYALISYGLTFLVRESMQLAAEEGARAALRYQQTRADRLEQARAVVQQNLAWLPQRLTAEGLVMDVDVCRLGSTQECAPNLICGSVVNSRCLVNVQLEIAYAQAPLVPAIPGLGLLLPATLTASASVLADPGGL